MSKKNRPKERETREPRQKKGRGFRIVSLLLALAMVLGIVVMFVQSMSW